MFQRGLHVWICLGACLAAGASAALAAGEQTTKPATRPRPVKVKVTLSRQTTYILGPVRKDGTPDYVAWVNAKLSKGVTPKNNAVVLLVRAIGPEMLSKPTAAKTLKRLGLASLPEKGEYFVPLKDYVEKHAPKEKVKPPPGLEQLQGKLAPEELARIRAAAQRPSEAQAQAEKHRDEAIKAPWSAKQYPMIAGWLKANVKPLALAMAAAKRPRYYLPLVSESDPPTMFGVLLPGMGRVRSAARAIAARAMYTLGRGNADAARADLLAMHRLARLVARGPTLVEQLVGIAIDSLACEAVQGLAGSGKLSAAQAKAVLRDLASLRPVDDVKRSIDHCERFFVLDAVMVCARDVLRKYPKLQKHQFDWDRILKRFNAYYDRLAAAFDKETFAARREAFAAWDRDLQKLAERRPPVMEAADAVYRIAKLVLFTPRIKVLRRKLTDRVGDVLLSLLLPSLGAASVIQDRCTMQLELARLSLALAAYRKEKGAYPAKLAELCPGLMKTIPKDIFTVKPLIYRRRGKGYVLYSVGENRRDDGGLKDGDEKDDIAVRVEGSYRRRAGCHRAGQGPRLNRAVRA